MTERFQPISAFKKEPYKKILCFPKIKESEIEKCHILGKGYVGMVVLAKKNNKILALKIRRTDSPRKNMTNEAKLLKIANKLDIGPKFIKNSKIF